MSGESSGWACEVPAKPSNKMQVSIIQFFDMATPLVTNIRDADDVGGGRARRKFDLSCR
jgi:hypothetical protein